jgi:hypothetical protein
MIAAAPALPPGARVRTGGDVSLRKQVAMVEQSVAVAPLPAAIDRKLFGHIFPRT